MFDWFRLKAELRRWRKAGRRPKLWWRDDDARTRTPQLARLLVKATRAGVPLSVSVIPEGLGPELCASLEPYPQVTVLQHGVRHKNRGGAAFNEFSPGQAVADIAAELVRGWAALEGFRRRLPVYVPPWNSLTPNVSEAIGLCDYSAVSGWGGDRAPGRLDAHIDLMRWKPSPRFAGRARVLGRLRRQLRQRRRDARWDQPIGLLTHHLAHDEAAWRFLETLLQFPPLERMADWPDAATLFGCGATPAD